jgi:hypothetical protein
VALALTCCHWRDACHSRNRWNPTSSAWSRRHRATASPEGSRSASGQQGQPQTDEGHRLLGRRQRAGRGDEHGQGAGRIAADVDLCGLAGHHPSAQIGANGADVRGAQLHAEDVTTAVDEAEVGGRPAA